MSTIADTSLNYYELEDNYRSGRQPEWVEDVPSVPGQGRAPEHAQVVKATGLGYIFSKDVLEGGRNADMQEMITISSRRLHPLNVLVDPKLERFVWQRRVEAHFYPFSP